MIGMYNNIILERHYKKGSRKGRFKISEKISQRRGTYDKAVMTPEKQLNPKDYEHRNSLVDKIKLSRQEAEDYKMKIVADAETLKMYEEYYKTHSYK